MELWAACVVGHWTWNHKWGDDQPDGCTVSGVDAGDGIGGDGAEFWTRRVAGFGPGDVARV